MKGGRIQHILNWNADSAWGWIKVRSGAWRMERSLKQIWLISILFQLTNGDKRLSLSFMRQRKGICFWPCHNKWHIWVFSKSWGHGSLPYERWFFAITHTPQHKEVGRLILTFIVFWKHRGWVKFKLPSLYQWISDHVSSPGAQWEIKLANGAYISRGKMTTKYTQNNYTKKVLMSWIIMMVCTLI